MAAINDLEGVLSPLPGYEILTPAMKQGALDMSIIPDSSNVWPGQPGYTTTYDIYWAALSLVGYLSAQPFIRQSSSEGTSVAVDAPTWAGIEAFFRGQSRIARANAAGPLLKVVGIPGSHVRRTDMSGRWDNDGDLDTDVS